MTETKYHRRLQSFSQALTKLKEAVAEYHVTAKPELIGMAVIKAFEFTYELAWKTAKDYIDYQSLQPVTYQREVIKEAFAHGMIQDGEAWIAMLEDRNITVHQYSESLAHAAIENIITKYVPLLEQLHTYLQKQQ